MSEYIPWIEGNDYHGLLGTQYNDFFIAVDGDKNSWDDENPEAAFLGLSGNDLMESWKGNNWFNGGSGKNIYEIHNKDALNVLVGGGGDEKFTIQGKESYIVTSDPVNPMTIKYDPDPEERNNITFNLGGTSKDSRYYVFDFDPKKDNITIKGQNLETDLINIHYGLSALNFRTAILSFKNGAKVLLNFADQQLDKFSNFMGNVKETMTYSYQKWTNKLDTLRGYAEKMGTLVDRVKEMVPTKLFLSDDWGDRHQFALVSPPSFDKGINLMGK